ncbi:sulfite oxidase [Achromobacter sp. NFACC18-2]|uniref:SorT family sulfite dehydrogenase catalytic subunit n=1 Tax=Achromobacter sp. NFACC18-2 TaxID=1564112 RepID=UPI0008BEC417|nr:sulfite oxidase [Achromobacter sp. NFACC18-2]SEJ03013.1 sulfite dehydrogenase (cytochrome) subunit SorA apoprotein [Achromobacter sp. NFACC18-2]
METTPLNPSRRRLLAGSAGALAAAGLGATGIARAADPAPKPAASAAKPLPPYAAWKDADSLIVHSANTIETRRSAFGDGVVTPSRQLYVRNNLPPPDAAILDDRDAWKVEILGVKHPRTLTVGELKTLGMETLATVLQCSGNGRRFFPHKPSGTQWEVGAAGCVIWTGVPVRALVDYLGGLDGTPTYMTGTGGEVLPEGLDPKSLLVERSVPREAMQDAMLAWEMNSEPLTLAHGAPLRLIVPGYTGVNNVKYLKRLAFTVEQSPAKIQQTSYRLTPMDAKSGPDQPSVWTMEPKSWITAPGADGKAVKAGRAIVRGVAFGGMHAVKHVDVSIDGGKTWKRAALIGPDLGKYAWRQFALPVELSAGQHMLVSRVEDTEGNVQVEKRFDNLRGYVNNSWRDHGLAINVS